MASTCLVTVYSLNFFGRGFFHGYSFVTVLMIVNHALRYIICNLY